MASANSGERIMAPPGKERPGTSAIISNLVAVPQMASDISFPASVAMATPWPE